MMLGYLCNHISEGERIM